MVGNEALPQEVQDSVTAIQSSVTCGSGTTIDNVPDVTSGSTTFSDVDFSKSSSSPLQFALDTFATPADPADADLATLQDQLNVYLATEAGLRSVGGSLAIKVPKFFLAMQVSRVQTAQVCSFFSFLFPCSGSMFARKLSLTGITRSGQPACCCGSTGGSPPGQGHQERGRGGQGAAGPGHPAGGHDLG